MTKKRSGKSNPRFNREVCVACTSCVDTCPTGALELVTRNSIRGFRRYPMMAWPEKCIGCGLCDKDCPIGAIRMIEVQGQL